MCVHVIVISQLTISLAIKLALAIPKFPYYIESLCVCRCCMPFGNIWLMQMWFNGMVHFVQTHKSEQRILVSSSDDKTDDGRCVAFHDAAHNHNNKTHSTKQQQQQQLNTTNHHLYIHTGRRGSTVIDSKFKWAKGTGKTTSERSRSRAPSQIECVFVTSKWHLWARVRRRRHQYLNDLCSCWWCCSFYCLRCMEMGESHFN